MFKLEVNETELKCVRFPSDLILEIEKVATEYNLTFSKVVIEAVKYALENMDYADKLKSSK